MADAQASYIIEIAAALESPDLGAAELARLETALTGAGKRSDDYQSALKRLESELDVATAASKAANAALADGSAQYAQLERAAIQTAKAVERAQAKGRFDPRAARDADIAARALADYEVELRKLETASASAGAAQKNLEGQVSRVTAAAKGADAANSKANIRYEKLSQAAGLLPGPLRSIAQEAIKAGKANQGLTAVFGEETAAAVIAAGAIVAVTAVLVAVAVAAVAAYAAFAKYAIVTADAGRSAELTREAFAALDDTTQAAVGSFDAITAATGLGDAQLIELTKSLRSANVSAADMPSALRAVATAEAALGKGGATEFVEQLRDGKVSARALAAEVNAKFGGVVAKRLLSLDSIGDRFSRNWAKLFSGLDLEPVLSNLDRLAGMFDRVNPLGQFFAFVIEKAFGPVSANAESAAVAIEAFALRVAINMTKAYIAVQENLTGIKDGFNATAAVLDIATGDIDGVIANVGAIAERHQAAFDASGQSLGGALAQGMVAGLSFGTGSVFETVAGLAAGIITTAKSVLGIASPSKEFAELGGHTAAGFAEGVDAGAPAASASLQSLVDPGQAEGTPPARKSGRGAALDLSGATFVFHGVADAEQAELRFGDLLTRLLEGDADSIAGAEVPA